MFGRLSIGKGFIAFLLPLTFVWSWAACCLLCDEISERHEKQSFSITEHAAGGEEHCLTDSDSCPLTALPAAIIEGRQTIFSPAPVAQNNISLLLPEASFIPVCVFPADVHKNSPPRFSLKPPLYLAHRAFRI